jgi:serine/threonine-protein kinase
MVDDEPTLRRSDELAATAPGLVTATEATVMPTAEPRAALLPLPSADYRYGELIGKGGMGEVMAAHDPRIGRDVAIKRMKSAHPDGEQLARFLREARIQARLDHPSIVPVHELSTDEAGRPFFTMKRVSGSTLAQKMADPTVSQQTLLRALIDVCQAVEFAHVRGVIHRDLKPANIMLGDYGEVYVLDWGVARVLTDTTRDQVGDIVTLDDGTQTGALLGTPGFMAPEQVKGSPATQASDVYALGAILFEILAGESLHPRGAAALSSTLTAPQDAPARRRSDRAIPPELDALCHAALAEDPIYRPTARGLGEQIQAYLDGDRDVIRRRAMAAQQLERAHAALAEGTTKGRAIAIHAAGRALALDPDSTEASELVTRLIVEPPDPTPRELVDEIAREERKVTAQRSKASLLAYLSLYPFWLMFPFLGVKNWGWLIGIYVVVTGMALYVYRLTKTGTFNIYIGLLGNLALATLWTRLAGPFILMPVLLCGGLLAMTTSSVLMTHRWLIAAWAAAAFAVPMALESVGVMKKSWAVTMTSIDGHSEIFGMAGTIGDLSLIGANILFVTMVGLIGVRVHKAAREAKRTVLVQAWHLRHLLPNARRTWGSRG